MSTDNFEQFFKMNKNLTGPMNDWYKLLTEMYQHTAQQNLELYSENVSRFSEQLKRLANIHKPEELLQEQRTILNEDVTAAVDTLQKVMHTNVESMEEFSKLCGTFCESATLQKYADKHQAEKTEKTHTERHSSK